MKFLLLLFFFIAAATASLDGNEIDSIKENYKKGLSDFKKILNTKFFPKAGDYFGIIERTIDYDCVAEKLEKYKLREELADIVANTSGFIETNRLKEVFYVFVKPVPKCFSMSRSIISNTLFDLIMSLGHIVRAFKDEPELAEYMDQFKCANNYAYEMNLLDASVYPFIYAEVPTCGELWKKVCGEIKSASGNDACLEETALNSIEFIIRTILLTQFKLKPEQYQKESDCFFNGYNEIADKAGLCGFRNYVEPEILRTMHPIAAFTMDFASNA